MAQDSSGLSDGCGVAQHAHGQVSTRYHSGRLVVNANLEASGAPVHKLDAALGLMVAMAALTSLGTTLPRYNRQQSMYLPWRGSHFTIWLAGSKQRSLLQKAVHCRLPSFFTFSFFPWTDLGLGCCSRAFSGCWSQGCSLVAVHGFRLPWLLWLQSLVAGEHGLPRGYWWCLLGPRVCRLKELWLMVLVAPQHVESSRTRIEPRSAGRFLSTMPAGESQKQILYIMLQHPVYKILSL